MVNIICPCCLGKGEIEERSPVHLSPMQFKIWDVVRRSKHGITGPDLTGKVYADKEDGGPLNANISVHVQIVKANIRLAPAKQRIVSTGGGPGALYRLKHTNV